MVFLVNLARVVFAPLLEYIAADFGVTVGSLGVVASAAWLGSALPRVPTGWLLTRIDRHTVVVGAGGVLTAAATLTASAPNVPALAAGAFLMGLASGVYFIAANPLVSELFPEGVGRALGIHGMASQTAAAGAPVIVIAVVAAFGDWRSTFLVVAVVAALTTAVLYLVGRRADLPDAGSDDRDLLGAARAQLPIILTGVLVTGSVGFVWNGLFNYYPTYMQAKDLDPQTASLMLSVLFTAGIPAFFLTGRLADRVPNVPLLLAVVAGFTACLFVLPHVTGLWPLVVFSVVLGYTIHSLFPAVDTYLLGTLPDRHRASAYTAYSATMMLPQAFGGGVVGSLTESGVTFDAMYTAFAAGLTVVLAALVALYLAGRLPVGRVGESQTGV
ncbi:MFS transporter [Halosegnis marinus]|uniref:MFS transporter n=1 Tax=Halosegnis marinus TaxID=3034023 RepID=A0ABD5ZQS7_9EURY|nr:MFS transporter [Halosegnis sp. DT85]